MIVRAFKCVAVMVVVDVRLSRALLRVLAPLTVVMVVAVVMYI